ncbi:MAG: leucyl/phenylalanyl-tRNA--protein transferase [Gammaproteobacteria bacterium]|nr:MAG: leucyl/phenylalanyl-tRNA--protein transferase [Gammaproteobacteria bacterium]
MSQRLYQLSANSLAFPPVENALTDPNGLLAIGGDLSCQRLISAYKNGIFPWFSEHDPLLWWSPNPRAIIKIADIKINKTLKKFLNKHPFTVTLNNDFKQVIELCSDAPFRKDGTWILPPMLNAYQKLHQQSVAHSIEVWHQQALVGGLYGIAINGFFSGESMFYTQSNASKVALVYLAHHLNKVGIQFIDCQLQNPFLESMGCTEITRENFVKLKEEALDICLPENFWQAQQLHLTF